MKWYLIAASAGFVAGVILTWLYARRLVHRAELALAGLGDMLPRKQWPPVPPAPPTPPRNRDPRG